MVELLDYVVFTKYTIIGGASLIFSIVSLVFLVDVLGLWVGYAGTINAVFVWFGRFLLYRRFGVVIRSGGS